MHPAIAGSDSPRTFRVDRLIELGSALNSANIPKGLAFWEPWAARSGPFDRSPITHSPTGAISGPLGPMRAADNVLDAEVMDRVAIGNETVDSAGTGSLFLSAGVAALAPGEFAVDSMLQSII
jgi:hypothetical protein